ncbi:MAG: hypothetical protein KF874_05680 [Rhizobiaceae bacterium]|nr:hypothetical protein [Rhizobiaceae bacterium]
MQQLPDAAIEWAVKGAGAIAGSAISLAYVLPRGRREAALRFFVGVACGMVFGGTVGVKLADELGVGALLGPNEIVLTGAAFASLSAWWALGLTLRFFQAEIGKKED